MDMPDFSDGELTAIMEKALRHAQKLEENAGSGGESHDGRASKMRASVYYFRLGMNRRIPAAWLPFVREMRQESDPEWEDYQRLCRKFSQR